MAKKGEILRGWLTNKSISLKIRVGVYETCVGSLMLSGAETVLGLNPPCLISPGYYPPG